MIDIKKFIGHTAGPWRFNNKPGETWTISSQSGDSLMGDEQYYPWTPDNEYDWALIAAAPDLLAEVIRLRAALEGIATHLDSDWPDRCQRHVRVARQALKGGTE